MLAFGGLVVGLGMFALVLGFSFRFGGLFLVLGV